MSNETRYLGTDNEGRSTALLNFVTWDPVGQDGRISLHQEDGQLGESVLGLLILVTPQVPHLGRHQLLHLGDGHLVPAAKRLGHNRDELDALLAAKVICLPHLPIEGKLVVLFLYWFVSVMHLLNYFLSGNQELGEPGLLSNKC